MKPHIYKRIRRSLIIILASLIVGGLFGYSQVRMSDTSTAPQRVAGSSVGGDFALTHHDGSAFEMGAHGDKHKLIYFGFTYCPSICPTELQKMSRVLDMLEGDKAASILPLFITIDPVRDDVATMRDYVTQFHPDLVGLTGTEDEVDVVIDQYKVYAQKVEDDTMSDYTVDHSSYIYLMSPDNELISIYRMADDVDYIVQDINTKIK